MKASVILAGGFPSRIWKLRTGTVLGGVGPGDAL